MAIDIDTPVVVAGVLLCLRHTSLQAATVAETTGAGRARPLHIEAQYDSVLIHRPAHPIARFSGIAARIVTTLAEFGGPVHWEVAANEVWIHITERDKLRRRWDRGLSSLRRKLAIAGVRTDLVRTQAGQVELVLAPEDELTVRGSRGEFGGTTRRDVVSILRRPGEPHVRHHCNTVSYRLGSVRIEYRLPAGYRWRESRRRPLCPRQDAQAQVRHD
jgi:hypothetical protein